jgi:monofunctional biosynthetic peptidoglycan transglycosylase
MKPDNNRSLVSRIWLWTGRIFLGLFIFQLFYIIILKWMNPPITITQFSSWISGDGLKRDYVSRSEISPNMRLAVIASEDQIFPDHDGFDWKSIKKAIEYNQKKPGRLHGGSTISQQVAKNIFLWQGRGWIRKGLEAYFTKMIEWIWGKQRILDVYVNVIEMGKGIYGVEAASQSYFKKAAKKLSRREAAMIAACLPNPKLFTVKPLSTYVASKSNKIVGQMNFLEKDTDVQRVINAAPIP